MNKMKKVALFAAASLMIASTACNNCGTSCVKLENAADSACYGIGVINGEGFAQHLKTSFPEEANIDAIIKGFSQALKGEETMISADSAQKYVQEFFETAAKRVAEKNLEEGKAFLDKNMAKEGVVTTESGLQYKVITEGTGKKPSATSTVTVHYTGKTLDGKVFDSSIERGEPTTFGVGQVIPGWKEALQLMSEGSKYELWIPSDIAYGASGAGASIPPHATLNFEVELIKIDDAK